MYSLPDDYKCNLSPKKYLDSARLAKFYQADVYRYARTKIEEHKINNVLDIGCGFGLKLQKYILPVCDDIEGIDSQHCIDYCQGLSFGQWHVDDIENPKLDMDRKFDLIMSSDVIEHLIDPDKLLSYITKHAAKYVIISTPDRYYEKQTLNEPSNSFHVREWSSNEFQDYISNHFRIIEHLNVKECDWHLTKNLRLLFHIPKTCQIVFCETNS